MSRVSRGLHFPPKFKTYILSSLSFSDFISSHWHLVHLHTYATTKPVHLPPTRAPADLGLYTSRLSRIPPFVPLKVLEARSGEQRLPPQPGRGIASLGLPNVCGKNTLQPRQYTYPTGKYTCSGAYAWRSCRSPRRTKHSDGRNTFPTCTREARHNVPDSSMAVARRAVPVKRYLPGRLPPPFKPNLISDSSAASGKFSRIDSLQHL